MLGVRKGNSSFLSKITFICYFLGQTARKDIITFMNRILGFEKNYLRDAHFNSHV